MNAARRGIKRRDWPRGLREPRPGYFAWEHPGGRILPIGRVPLATAKAEALAANMHIANQRPTLVDRLAGVDKTVTQLLEKMPEAENKNTAKTWRTLDKTIRAELGHMAASAVTVRHCAEVLERIADEGKSRTAQALRSRMMAVFAKGQALGWCETNPAEPTRTEAVEVRRGRLTLDMFREIYEVAPQVNEWLQRAMALALVTGADRVTIASLTRANIVGDDLVIQRSKTKNSTGLRVAIPLDLHMNAMGWTLRDLANHRTGVLSPYLLHRSNPYGNAPAGSAIFNDRISKAFTAARKLAKIPDTLPDGKKAPTFHEIRALAKQTYDEQGGVDTKTLLAHSTDRAAAIYADPRGSAPVRVKLG